MEALHVHEAEEKYPDFPVWNLWTPGTYEEWLTRVAAWCEKHHARYYEDGREWFRAEWRDRARQAEKDGMTVFVMQDLS